MTRQGYPRRNPGSAFRDFGEDGGLIVNPAANEVKVLNSVGSKIFALLDGEHSLEAIARAVAEEFDVDTATARADVEAFVADLEARGMLAPDTRETLQEEP